MSTLTAFFAYFLNHRHQPAKHTDSLSSSPNLAGDYVAFLPSVASCRPSPAHPLPWKFTQPTSCLFVCEQVSWRWRPGPFCPENETMIVLPKQEMEHVLYASSYHPVATLSSGSMGNSMGEQTGTLHF